jgi:microcin C transport system permease protein
MVAMSGMTVYFIRRLLLVPVTFFVITFMVYTILRIVPGGPIEQAEARMRMAEMSEGGGGGGGGMGEESDLQIDESAMAELEAYYALDRSIPVGYLQWLGLWPRERKLRVPLVPENEIGNEEAIRRLRTLEGEELRRAERETGIFLDESGRAVRLPHRPLLELHRVRAEAEEGLGEHLKGPGLVEFRGVFFRRVTEEEKAARAELFEEAGELSRAGFGKRDELLDSLWPEHTWRAEKFYVRLTPDETGNDPEFFRTARELVARRHLANEKLGKIREEFGFEVGDDGRVYQVESRLSGIIQLDFGQSHTYNEPVLGLIGSKMEVSVQFGLIGYFLTWLVCIPLGVFKGIKHRSTFDTGSSVLVFLGYSIPGFVLCLVLLSTLAVNFDWLPLGGYKPANIEDLGWWDSVIGRIRHMLIPVAGYMIGGFAAMTILMKNSLLENLSQDYVRTAFAKGLSEKRVIFVHALRNSLIPVTAGIGHALGLLFAGSFLIEKACNIDGMGLLGFEAIKMRDYPITLGLMVFLVLIRLFGNILSDIIWALIDPRIRFGK